MRRVEVPVDELSLSHDVTQVKIGANDGGLTEPLGASLTEQVLVLLSYGNLRTVGKWSYQVATDGTWKNEAVKKLFSAKWCGKRMDSL
jgi:hypothetical protein